MADELSPEDQAWAAAYHIAWVGASNQSGIEKSIEEHSKTVGDDHPAVIAMTRHLMFLRGDGLGPSMVMLGRVRQNAIRLGLISEG